MSRAKARSVPFKHNSVKHLEDALKCLCIREEDIREGRASVFIAVESLYSMDGDFAPLQEMVATVERILPLRNGYIIVDEAHSTGLCGEQGRGYVNHLGLEDKIAIRLHTFGKALACSGAVILASPLVRSYLVNYARTLIYTTSMSYASVLAIESSFDMLEEGEVEKLRIHIAHLFRTFISYIKPDLSSIPPHLLHIPTGMMDHAAHPTPIIPVMTSHARPLAAFLNHRGHYVRAIVWPTVPKGLDRVRVCLHAGNSQEEIESLVRDMLCWAQLNVQHEDDVQNRNQVRRTASHDSVISLQAKL